MKNFALLFLTLFITTYLQAQTGLQITSTCQSDSLCLPANECVAIDQTFSISATTDCSTSNIVEYNFFIDWNDDGVVDSLGSASNFTADFPIGTHRVKFTAFDFCGGEENCEFVFAVMDCVAPVIECPTAIDTFYISSAGLLYINVEEFISSNTFDNCTTFEDLRFSFSQDPADTILTYICGDVICDMFEQTIWVTDEAGNQDSCLVNFYVIEIHFSCFSPTTSLIILNTENWYQEEMENVEYLHNGIPYYPIINNNLPCGPIIGPENDTVYASYNVMPLNGVTTFDLVLISKHILGTEIFDNPYKLIAADANNSGTITALDLVTLRSLILYIIDDFPSGQSWVFDPPFHVVNHNQNINYEFIGIKLGDVNGTANPNDFQNNHIDTRTYDGTLNLSTKNQTFKTGETITITTFSNNFEKIIGGQLTIDFDPTALKFQSIEGNHSIELGEQNFGKKDIDDGFILCSWNTSASQNLNVEEAFCNITFTAKKDGKLSDYLTLNSKKINAEVYVENGNEMEFWNAELRFENEVHNNTFTISPNPFSEQTTFNFSLENAGQVEVEIFDSNGRLVFSQQKHMQAGKNKIEIQKANLVTNGIYFYKIKTDQRVDSGKLILF
jgi:hypothetical protein